MSKQNWKFIRNIFIAIASAGLVILILPRVITAIYSWPRVYTADTVPTERVAIVFGAGLTREGQPTLILKDRVRTAAQLYLSGKVQKLLMSGDNRFVNYNEPEAMRQYALSLGVPDNAIVLDYAGRRTYDTCYRAKAIFGLEFGAVGHATISYAARIIFVQHAWRPSRRRGGKQLLVLAPADVDLEHPRATRHGWRILGFVY